MCHELPYRRGDDRVKQAQVTTLRCSRSSMLDEIKEEDGQT